MDRYKKALMIIAIVAIIAIAGSLFYYFVFFKPELIREELTFQKEKYELEQKEKQENKQALERCLKEVEDWEKESYVGIFDLENSKDENIEAILKLIQEEYRNKVNQCDMLYGY
jgi:uncharacterized protein HemX